MTANNLAVCFVPAFFHLCGASDDVVGHPKRVKRPAINKAAKELSSGLVSSRCLHYTKLSFADHRVGNVDCIIYDSAAICPSLSKNFKFLSKFAVNDSFLTGRSRMYNPND